jgi:hypothetical protein
MNEARRLLEQLSRTRPRALPPGYSVIRVVTLLRRAIAATGVDLSAVTVLTEAASEACGVTAVIAAMAGARQVHAFTRPSRYGSVSEVSDWTSQCWLILIVDSYVIIFLFLPQKLRHAK